MKSITTIQQILRIICLKAKTGGFPKTNPFSVKQKFRTQSSKQNMGGEPSLHLYSYSLMALLISKDFPLAYPRALISLPSPLNSSSSTDEACANLAFMYELTTSETIFFFA